MSEARQTHFLEQAKLSSTTGEQFLRSETMSPSRGEAPQNSTNQTDNLNQIASVRPSDSALAQMKKVSFNIEKLEQIFTFGQCVSWCLLTNLILSLLAILTFTAFHLPQGSYSNKAALLFGLAAIIVALIPLCCQVVSLKKKVFREMSGSIVALMALITSVWLVLLANEIISIVGTTTVAYDLSRLVNISLALFGFTTTSLILSLMLYEIEKRAVELSVQLSGLPLSDSPSMLSVSWNLHRNSRKFIQQAKNAVLLKEGGVSELSAGDRLFADACILSGIALVEEAVTSGELLRAVRKPGDELFSGTRIIEGNVKVNYISSWYDSERTTYSAPHSQQIENIRKDNEQRAMMYFRSTISFFVFFSMCSFIFWYRLHALWQPALLEAVLLSSLLPLLLLTLIPFYSTLEFLSKICPQGVIILTTRSGELLKQIGSLWIDVGEARETEIPPISKLAVEQFVVHDSRVDLSALSSVLLILASAMGDENGLALRRHLSASVKKVPSWINYGEIHVYSGRGACGSIDKAEVTLGTESFLLDRGVQFELSDLVQTTAQQRTLYLAIEDRVVAHLILNVASDSAEKQAVRTAWQNGLKVYFVAGKGADEANAVSAASKLGLPRSQVLIGGTFGHVENFGTIAWYRPAGWVNGASKRHEDSLQNEEKHHPVLRIAPFDQLRCEFKAEDISVLSAGISPVVKLILALRRVSANQIFGILLWAFFSGILVLPMVLQLISPALGEWILVSLLCLGILILKRREPHPS